jgi:imidazolonepropionase-like amidohydrolase
MAVLRAATTVPAAYLARPDLGGISVGKRADLVLLQRNPLLDIANTQAIEAVVADGRLFTKVQLDQLLTSVRKEHAR